MYATYVCTYMEWVMGELLLSETSTLQHSMGLKIDVILLQSCWVIQCCDCPSEIGHITENIGLLRCCEVHCILYIGDLNMCSETSLVRHSIGCDKHWIRRLSDY